MLTHGNIVSNLLQTSRWWGTGLREGEEVIITALPLYHIFALTGNCLAFMKIGGAQRAHHQPARPARLREGARQLPLHLRSPA
jgi:acyl-CoA synthetase (AMP-forming)/AMP-acid ligase II